MGCLLPLLSCHESLLPSVPSNTVGQKEKVSILLPISFSGKIQLTASARKSKRISVHLTIIGNVLATAAFFFHEIKHKRQVLIRINNKNEGKHLSICDWKDSSMRPLLRNEQNCALLSVYLLSQIVNGPFLCSLWHYLHQKQNDTDKKNKKQG